MDYAKFTMTTGKHRVSLCLLSEQQTAGTENEYSKLEQIGKQGGILHKIIHQTKGN